MGEEYLIPPDRYMNPMYDGDMISKLIVILLPLRRFFFSIKRFFYTGAFLSHKTSWQSMRHWLFFTTNDPGTTVLAVLRKTRQAGISVYGRAVIVEKLLPLCLVALLAIYQYCVRPA